MNTVLKRLLFPLIWLRRKHDDYLRRHNPEKLFSLFHKRITGMRLDTKNPKTLYDKIAYMAFHTDTLEWSRMADKLMVRDYVTDCGFKEYLANLYGYWDDPDKICFNDLPNSFILKTNNGCATNVLIKDKSQLSDAQFIKIKDDFRKWLSVDYGYLSCQPHYSRIKPYVFAEQLLVDEASDKQNTMLVDYKFYCINGTPLYVFVYTGRKLNSHTPFATVYDMKWNKAQEMLGENEPKGPDIVCPSCFDIMKQIASTLSKPFPFVRVDLYNINGHPYFGEMTFTPGFEAISSRCQTELGAILNVPISH